MKVKNEYGYELDFEDTVSYMIDEIREQVHQELVMQSDKDCTEQEFFDEYCKEHEKATGEEWKLAKENPCW